MQGVGHMGDGDSESQPRAAWKLAMAWKLLLDL